MEKFEFTTEFEINAADHLIFPYLSTAAGLKDWFAQEVYKDRNELINFVWNDKNYQAKIVSLQPESRVVFEMMPENAQDEEDPSELEFQLDYSELTQSTFLRIRDYSEMDDEEELQALWSNMVDSLRAALGA